MSNDRCLVTHDFARHAPGTFWRILHDEFTGGPGGDCEFIQRSVAICKDDLTAYRLAALAESCGAKVAVYAVSHDLWAGGEREEAIAYIERLRRQRLQRRGRK